MKPLLAIFFLISLALAGCKKGPSIVGTWTTTAMGASQEITFQEGGKFTGVTQVPHGMGSVSSDGTWTLNDKDFSLKIGHLDTPSLTYRRR